MNQYILLLAGVVALTIGAVLGYYTRQSIATKRLGTVDQKLQEKVVQAQKECEALITQSKEKAVAILDAAKEEENQLRNRVAQTEQLVLRREDILNQKLVEYDKKEKDFQEKVEKLKGVKENLEGLQTQAVASLERVSKLKKEEARAELMAACEREAEMELMEKMRKLEQDGAEKVQRRAKEMIALAIQKCALSQSQEMTTSTVALPNEEIKGRIIGKEGRNIRTLEKLTGVPA